MDWDNIWGQAKESISGAWDNAVATGLPVIKASAEKQLLDVLNKQHQQTKEELNQAVAAAVAGPETATGQVVKEALFEQYKYHILGGVVALIGIGYLVRK